MNGRALYIYEIIHTLNREAKLLIEHVERGNRAAKEIFNIDNCIDANKLSGEIKTLLSSKNSPRGLSVHVRVEIYEGGDYSLFIEEVSIYSGYSLRCYDPTAAIIPQEIPLPEHSTGASEQISHLERVLAKEQGADIALRCNHLSEITAANNSPIFAAKSRVIYVSKDGVNSAEKVAILKLLGSHFTVVNHVINLSDIELYDELFYIDHYGVTAIKRVNSRVYMNAVARAVAEIMEGI